MSLFTELKNRNVFRVAAAYIVSAWLVIQVVETILPAFGFGDAAVRYVTIAFAVALIPVLVLSWVFEWTPEGIRRESEVDDHAPASVAAARRFDRLILIVLALALGYFAFDKFVLAPQQRAKEVAEARQEGRSEALVESYGDQSIAVLAFQDMSPAKDQEYLSDGIAEEILNLLAKIPQLRVISRSSAFTFKGRDVPIPEIARQLNVAHILEGSVRRAGGRIRITAQLIEARSDTHIWSETYDRTLTDVFAIQDEIAADVVEYLELILTRPLPASRRTDPEAYALTLQARRLLELGTNTPNDQVAELLERALAIDPSYVPALEAQLWLDYVTRGGSGSNEDFENRWRILRDRILALDPDNGMIHSWLAWALYEDEHDIEGAAAKYQALIEREPNNPEVVRVAGSFLRRIGHFDDAARVLNRCIQIDPLMNRCSWALKETYFYAGDLERARAVTERLEAMWGPQLRTHDALLFLLEGRPEDAKTLVESWPREWDPRFRNSLLAMVAFDQGDVAEYQRRISEFRGVAAEEGDPFWTAFQAAGVYAHVGELDAAFDQLDQAADLDKGEMIKEVFYPLFRNLHGDPRWQAHRERLDMTDERLAAIEFEVPAGWPVPEDLGPM